MRPTADWLELSLVAIGLTLGMFILMWADGPSTGCTLPTEAPRRLMLDRETDREHLATDVASVDRIAQRYMQAGTDPAERQQRRVECDATLLQQIAVRHGLSPDRVRLNPTDSR